MPTLTFAREAISTDVTFLQEQRVVFVLHESPAHFCFLQTGSHVEGLSGAREFFKPLTSVYS